MPNQIMGHYNSSKEKLLKNLDGTAALLKNSLATRFGEEFVYTLQREIRQEYEKLIPEIPYIKGMRAKPLNTFLIITAQELAVYKAMKKKGKSPAETWELCHQALRLSVAKIPRWKDDEEGAIPDLPTVSHVWRTADWHEREAYDMCGMQFENHPDHRRILLPDDWDGFPLRKDYEVQEFYHGIRVPV